LSFILTEGITEPTDFRFYIECEATENTDVSNTVSVSLNPYTECYCAPDYAVGCDQGDEINRVRLTDSDDYVVLDNESDCSENGYGDYTDQLDPTEVLQGETYTLSVETDFVDPTPEDLRAWIDFDANGIFDPEEEIANTNGEGFPADGQVNFQFAVPGDQDFGTYRLRVRMSFSGGDDIDPCSIESFGETEDYLIEVVDEYGMARSHFEGFSFYPNPVVDQLHLHA